MQLSGLIGRAGATPIALDVQADVSLVPDPAGGVRIDKIHLTVRGEVEGMDAETFVKTAENAKATCPVSKALTGVDEMTVDASLCTTRPGFIRSDRPAWTTRGVGARNPDTAALATHPGRAGDPPSYVVVRPGR